MFQRNCYFVSFRLLRNVTNSLLTFFAICICWGLAKNFRSKFVAISRSMSCEMPRVSLSNEISRNFALSQQKFSGFHPQNWKIYTWRLNLRPRATVFKWFLGFILLFIILLCFISLSKIFDMFNIGVRTCLIGPFGLCFSLRREVVQK